MMLCRRRVGIGCRLEGVAKSGRMDQKRRTQGQQKPPFRTACSYLAAATDLVCLDGGVRYPKGASRRCEGVVFVVSPSPSRCGAAGSLAVPRRVVGHRHRATDCALRPRDTAAAAQTLGCRQRAEPPAAGRGETGSDPRVASDRRPSTSTSMTARHHCEVLLLDRDLQDHPRRSQSHNGTDAAYRSCANCSDAKAVRPARRSICCHHNDMIYTGTSLA